MSGIADVFPVLAFLVASVLVFVTIRTSLQLSGGAENAGPLITPTQEIHGLASESSDARSIARLLRSDPNQVVSNMRDLSLAEGVDSTPTSVDPHREVEVLVSRLEKHLDLPSLTIKPGQKP